MLPSKFSSLTAGLFVMLGVLLAETHSYQDPAQKPKPKVFRAILPVRDLDEAQAFYSSLLGTEVRSITPSRRYMDMDNMILALFHPTRESGMHSNRPNAEPFYFAVEDLDAFFQRAQKVGGLFTETDHNLPMGKITRRPWGELSFYMRDPSGNPLCFVKEDTVFTGH